MGLKDLLLGGVTAGAQMISDNQARAANEKRYRQIIDAITGGLGLPKGTAPEDIARLAGGDVSSLERQNADLLAGMEGNTAAQLADYDATATKLRGISEGDYNRMMSYLDKYGNQELADIDRVTNEQDAGVNAAMQNAGLAGTSIATSGRRGVLRERADQLGRARERQALTRLNTDQALSADRANLEASLSQGRDSLAAQLGDRNIGLRDDLASRRFDFVSRGLNRMMDTVEGRTDAYPDPGTYMGLMSGLGQGAGVRQHIASQRNDWFKNVFGGIGASAGGSAAGTVAGVGIARGLFPAAVATSDRRAKKDISPIGELRRGLPLYAFRYRGEPRRAPLRIGVMAQDVEKRHPEAVHTERSGLKSVDYGALMRLEHAV